MEAPPPINRKKCLVGMLITKARRFPECYDLHKCKIDIPNHEVRLNADTIYNIGYTLAQRFGVSVEESIAHFREQCKFPRQSVIAHCKDEFIFHTRILYRRYDPSYIHLFHCMPWKMFLLDPDVQPED